MTQRNLITLALASLVGIAGCMGTIGAGDDGSSNGTSGGSAGSGGGVADGAASDAGVDPMGNAPGSMALRRLGKTEYQNTVQDLFGPMADAGVILPQDPLGPSTYASPTDIGSVEQNRFEQGAQNLAASITDPAKTVAPCSTGADERACASAFLGTFGGRVFRRPLSTDETAQLLALYDQVRAAPISDDYTGAIRVLVTALLQSPQFLYHWELGPNPRTVSGGNVVLTPYELASRLSYFLWATMPDDALMKAAQSGGLDTPGGVAAQAQRMLADPKAAQLPISLFGQWIGIDKVAGLVKDPSVVTVSDAMRQSIRGQFEASVAYAALTDGMYRTLLTDSSSFVDGTLAPLYGLTGVSGSTFQRAPTPERSGGLFTQLAFLAVQSLPQEDSPVRRGKLVAERLLCRTISPPPPNFAPQPPAVPPGATTRQAYAAHSSVEPCKSCHSQMDPYGFAFENFDAIGRYRTTQSGQPVDATGTLAGLDGHDVPFQNAGEMLQHLADSQAGKDCMIVQYARFALGRQLGPFDQPSLAAIRTAAQKGPELDLRQVAAAIAASPSFRTRVPSPGEVLQ